MEVIEKIIGVSLGPGDPELVTLKALKILQQSDVVFCPLMTGSGGMVKSRAYDILKSLPVEQTRIHLYNIPISQVSEGMASVCDSLCCEMQSAVAEGKRVAFAFVGDACFYSSVNCLYEKLVQSGTPVELIAGVPAFIAAASSIGLPIARGQERVLVLSGDVLVEELLESVVLKRSLVIVNVSLGEAVLRPFIVRHSELEIHYFENVGTSEEFHSSCIEKILARPFVYSSILIIRTKK